MSEHAFAYSANLDLTSMVDDIAKRIQDEVDQAALDKAAATLAKFGYEKVVRCRDCAWYKPFHSFAGAQLDEGICEMTRQFVGEDGFCAWAERMEQ